MSLRNEQVPLDDGGGNGEYKYNELLRKEVDLCAVVLNQVSSLYKKAADLNSADSKYLFMANTESPEPTEVFRMDSKDAYLVENGRLAHQKLLFYVPQDRDSDNTLDRLWVQHEQPNGAESMFAITSSGAYAYYPSSEEEEVGPMVAESEAFPDDDSEISPDDMYESAIKQKKLILNGLRVLARVVREDFKLVPHEIL